MPVPLARAGTTRVAAPLPDPFPVLARSKFRVQFRPGQLAMLAGAPGAGKTCWALIAAIRMGVPTLYISADSDEDTMAARAAAAITGHETSVVHETMVAGLYREEYGELVDTIPIRFVFEPSEPTMADIANALSAYVELHGQTPKLIVVDNLMNCRGEHGDEWTGMRRTCQDLHYLGRKTRAAVLVLHHTSEQDSSHIQTAPPRTAIQGKVSQLPALILTLANHDGEMFVGVVKNRHGKSDPLAQEPLRFFADLGRMSITQAWTQHQGVMP